MFRSKTAFLGPSLVICLSSKTVSCQDSVKVKKSPQPGRFNYNAYNFGVGKRGFDFKSDFFYRSIHPAFGRFHPYTFGVGRRGKGAN